MARNKNTGRWIRWKRNSSNPLGAAVKYADELIGEDGFPIEEVYREMIANLRLNNNNRLADKWEKKGYDWWKERVKIDSENDWTSGNAVTDVITEGLGPLLFNSSDGSVSNGMSNLWNKWTGSDLTPAEQMTNQINISEAQKQRDYEERLANTQYQRGVVDMKAAGVNPALLYGNGASPAPTPAGATATAISPAAGMLSFGDLVGLLKLPLEMAQMKANVDNTNIRNKGEELKNQYQSLVNGFYPSMTTETINKIRKEIAGIDADIDVKKETKSLVHAQSLIAEAEGKLADELADAKLQLMKDQASQAAAAAVASAARAAMDAYEAQYMRANNMKMGTNDYVALATALLGYFDTDAPSVVKTVTDTVKDKLNDAGEIARKEWDEVKDNYSGSIVENGKEEIRELRRSLRRLRSRIFGK